MIELRKVIPKRVTKPAGDPLLASLGVTLGIMIWVAAAPGRSSRAAGIDQRANPPTARNMRIEIRPASLIKFPGVTDCNSPVHWDGDTLYLFNSAPVPWRSSGPDLFRLGPAS